MRIAVLANQEMMNEIRGKKSLIHPEWIWLKSVHELKELPGPEAIFDFEFRNDPQRIEELASYLPKPIFINALSDCLQEIRKPFIRFNGWPGFFNRNILEMTFPLSGSMEAEVVLRKLGWDWKVVADIPGLISARIIALIINEAYYTFQEGISTKGDIDIAMKLGTGYPFGPFEWSDKIGIESIYALLLAMQKEDRRYTIAESLANESKGVKKEAVDP